MLGHDNIHIFDEMNEERAIEPTADLFKDLQVPKFEFKLPAADFNIEMPKVYGDMPMSQLPR